MSLVLKPPPLSRLREKGYAVVFAVKLLKSGVYAILDEEKKWVANAFVPLPAVVHPTLEELEDYVPYSGYPSAVAWLSAIKLMYKEFPKRGYLYLLVKTPITRELIEEVSRIPKIGGVLREAKITPQKEHVQPPSPKPKPKPVKLSEYFALPKKRKRKLKKITSIRVTYYPSAPPPSFHPITVVVRADDIDISFTQLMLTPTMKIPKTEIEKEGRIYVLGEMTIPLPPRPKFWLGDFVETHDKTYQLVKATARYEDGKYTPWKWTVWETDKLLGTVIEYELTEEEWDEKRKDLGAPPYVGAWTWTKIPEKVFPVLKPSYPATRHKIPIYPRGGG